VPLLGDIPLVGQLFRYTSQDTSKRNLMVFIHTTVLRDDDTYSASSKEKYDQIRARQQQRLEESKFGIVAPEGNAVLPDYPAMTGTATVKSRNPFKE
ncbi:MAG: type II secretion system protein GspD, partial [Leclercia adecarboxylata]|nr:type II secretion system protein GspD [Leclercia adecarboxylata]